MLNTQFNLSVKPVQINRTELKPVHKNSLALQETQVKFGKIGNIGDNFKEAEGFRLTIAGEPRQVARKLHHLYEKTELTFKKTQSSKKKEQTATPFWGDLTKAKDGTYELLMMKKIKYNNPNTPVLKLTFEPAKYGKSTIVTGEFTEVKSLWTKAKGDKTLPSGLVAAGVGLGVLVNPLFLLYVPIGGGTYAFTKKMKAKESAELKEAALKALNR